MEAEDFYSFQTLYFCYVMLWYMLDSWSSQVPVIAILLDLLSDKSITTWLDLCTFHKGLVKQTMLVEGEEGPTAKGVPLSWMHLL